METSNGSSEVPTVDGLSYTGEERREATPVEVITFKDGAKLGLWSLFITVLIQIVLLTAFIVTTRARVTSLEAGLADHVRFTEPYIMMIPAMDQKVEDTKELLQGHMKESDE